MDSITAKQINTILFFANKMEENTIDRLKLVKLIWLADRIHLNKHGRTITKDTYYALPHGPIASQTLNLSNKSKENFYTIDKQNITAIKEFDANYFSKSDLEILEFVWDNYKEMSSTELRNFSHNFPEWKRFKKELEDPEKLNRYSIVMDDFFIKPDEGVGYDPNISNEDIELSKSEFHSYTVFQSFLTN